MLMMSVITVMIVILTLGKSYCNVCRCCVISEETGGRTESVAIHLMTTRNMNTLRISLLRTMGTNVSLGMTVIQRMVVLPFPPALIIIMVYHLQMDHNNSSRCVVTILLMLGGTVLCSIKLALYVLINSIV